MSVGVALVWSTRIYIFININRRGGAKSKLRDLFLSSKFHNERVLYFWIFSAIFAYHLHPLYFCALEFSINAWTSEWWIIEPVLIKDKPHRIHRMRFAFALFINKWTDLAKFSSFFFMKSRTFQQLDTIFHDSRWPRTLGQKFELFREAIFVASLEIPKSSPV